MGVVLVVVGVLGPWAYTKAPAGSATAGGIGHGGGIALTLAALAAAALLLFGSRMLAVPCGAAAVAWTVLALYVLPENLLDGPVNQADLAWGTYLALLGALVVLASAALAPPLRQPT